MSNVFATFRRLLPQPVELVGEVITQGTEQHVIELPGGGIVTARGSATQGQWVHVRDGVITGPASAPFGTEHEE